jgi:hypothetical protein
MGNDTPGASEKQPETPPDARTAGQPTRRRRRTPAASANGQPAPVTPPADNGQPDDATLLKDAVTNPGGGDIPEEPLTTGGADLEIPTESISPAAEACGRRIDNDPATMCVSLSKPTANSWIQLFPDHVFDTVFYEHKPLRENSGTFYYVQGQTLRDALRPHHFKNVRIYLAFDVIEDGEFFLWQVSRSERSAYLTAVTSILSRGAKYVADNTFNFDYVFGRNKVFVNVEPRKPTDPVAVLPTRPLGRLLREAMGDRYIDSTDHPMWPVLTMGRRLS